MSRVLQAVYANGNLVLSEALDPSLEGKPIKVVILDTDVNEQAIAEQIQSTDSPDTEAAEPDPKPSTSRARAFLKFAKRYSATFPSKHQGDREG